MQRGGPVPLSVAAVVRIMQVNPLFLTVLETPIMTGSEERSGILRHGSADQKREPILVKTRLRESSGECLDKGIARGFARTNESSSTPFR